METSPGNRVTDDLVHEALPTIGEGRRRFTGREIRL
jgi:hypothetical protein